MVNIMCRNSYFKEESVIMAFIDTIYARAKADKKTIVLPESMDKRTFAAAEKILKEGIANLIIIGTPEEIAENSKGYDITGATIVDPFNDPNKQKYIDKFVELRAKKGVTPEMAKEQMEKDYMYYACLMCKCGDADGAVSGACHSTGNTIRPALQLLKTKPGISSVSGFFLMEVPNCELGENGLFVFAAHLFVTPEQIKDEISKVVDLIFSTYKDFGITDYRCVLSLRDPENKTKYHDDDEMWNKAENALRDVMNSIGIEYTEEIGEAAFYGPKLDVNVKPAVGNEITLSTCQLDFCLPAKFNLSYVDKDGEKKTPVVLHRAILGSLDRFMAYILEETKGNLPTWLAPVQVRVMPVKTDNDEIMNYAHEIVDALEAKNVRVELDDRAEKLGYRMREGQIQKVPYLLVIGFNEQENKTVSYRLHGQQDTTTLGLDEFVEKIDTEIKNKAR